MFSRKNIKKTRQKGVANYLLETFYKIEFLTKLIKSVSLAIAKTFFFNQKGNY